MVLENLFAHARATPDKIALYYGPHSVSYRDFAFWIACARRFLDRQDLRPGSMAVLAIESLVDSWVLGLALRSMGLTTVSVKALDVLDDMAAEDVGCVVTSIAEALPRSVFPGVKCKYMQIDRKSTRLNSSH